MRDDKFASVSRLLESELFDSDWYQAAYPDVRLSGLDAAEHYVRIGRRLGRHGSPDAFAVHRSLAAPAGGDRPIASNLNANRAAIRPELRALIQRSRLMDERWYCDQYATLVRDAGDLLSDYHNAFLADPHRDPGPLFSTADYLAANPDVQGMHPFLHFIEYGLAEGRAGFAARKVDRFHEKADLGKIVPLTSLIRRELPTSVLVWTDGNFFFRDIAEYTAAYLRALGFAADCLADEPGERRNDRNLILVAPHEFCVYGPGKNWRAEELERAVYLNTEQWQTSWFSLAYSFIMKSGKALDINPASAATLAELGFESGFIPLLPLEGTCFAQPDGPLSASLLSSKAVKDLDYPKKFLARAYDVLFVGALNDKRSKALACLASKLQAFDCFIHCPSFDGPVRDTDADMLCSSDLAQLARNSKILLNIHQGDAAYFEWHRLFVSGILEGSVVVTEPCVPTGIVFPNEHYLEASVAEMPALIEHLLGTAEGRKTLQRIHRNCRRLRDEILSSGKVMNDYAGL